MKAWAEMNLTEFKDFCDEYDQEEDQKSLITIRQGVKKSKRMLYRKKKLAWVVKLIKSLEFTKKSRGAKPEPNYDLDDIEFERRNR